MAAHEPDPGILAKRARIVLVGGVVITIALYLVPFGRVIARPLLLFSTLVHEIGHGIAAILVGGRFEALLMWSDGSGVATWSALVGRIGHAVIAAGGLVGPAIGAAICLGGGRKPRSARIVLLLMGVFFIIAEIFVVRTLFGFLFVGAVILIFIATALLASPWLSQLLLVFIGVQLGLSVFSRADYLFTPIARTGGGVMPSDTARIAEALVLPYWFWGGCCGLFSVIVLFIAFVFYLRPEER